MKIVKYITGFILIFIAFVFAGEMYVWHLDSFETEYSYVTFYLQKNTSIDEMINDIYSAAKKEDVEVFVVDKQVNSLFSEKINLYGTDEVESILYSDANISGGNYNSIFLGNVDVIFSDFSEIKDISKFEDYYVIGNDENIVKFKQELVDKYAGKFPQRGYQSINSILNISVVWGIVLLFLLLLTFYEIALKKKEVIVRMISGEQIGSFVIKQIIEDVLFYAIVFFSTKGILANYTNVEFYKSISILVFLIFLLLNSFLYVSLFLINYKRDVQTQKTAQNILKISYIYQAVTIFLTIITMSGSMELIFDGMNYYHQKDFFESRRDYTYWAFGLEEYEKLSAIMEMAYKQAMDGQTEISLVDLDDWGDGVDYVLADRGAQEYLKTEIPMLDNINLEEKVYFMIPKEYSGQKEIVSHIKDIWSSYYNGDLEYELIEYRTDAEIMAISNVGKIQSAYKKNPVIIYNNMTSESLSRYINILYIGNSTMYKISDDDWNQLISDNGFEDSLYYRTNVYDNYNYHWNIMKRNMMIGATLFMILLLLEGFIIKTILNYEYQVNAKKITLSKIFGETLLSRHRKILLTSGIFGMIGLSGALIVCWKLNFSSVFCIAAGGLSILLVEILLVIRYIQKLDKTNIYRILKGGSI